jgi:hypothetical protein
VDEAQRSVACPDRHVLERCGAAAGRGSCCCAADRNAGRTGRNDTGAGRDGPCRTRSAPDTCTDDAGTNDACAGDTLVTLAIGLGGAR